MLPVFKEKIADGDMHQVQDLCNITYHEIQIGLQIWLKGGLPHSLEEQRVLG
jgi:hypothetical protein